MEIISSLSFWINAILIIISAICTVFLPKISYCILSAFITFILFALLYFQLSAPFNGVVQIIIYAVTMSVLFAFGIMFTNSPKDDKKYLFLSPRLLLTIVGIMLIICAITGILNQDIFFGLNEFLIISAEHLSDPQAAIKVLGETLFTKHIFAFEILSLLLLAGIIAVFVFTTKGKKEEESANE